MQVVLRKPLATLQERQLDDEAAADDLPAEHLHKLLADRLDRSAGGKDVVVDQDACAPRDHVRMELERVLPVLERIGRADGFRRELSRTPCRDEPAADLPGNRCAEDEAARLGTEHEIEAFLPPPLRQLL